MKVSLARNIDYWLGVPICFILTLLYRIQKIFISEKLKKIKPKKILFLGFSEMGSIILAYSAISKVKKLYPGADIYFWTFEESREVLSFIETVREQNIITIRFRSFFLFIDDVFRSIRFVRKHNIDTAVDLELFSRFSAILAFLSGAFNRVGFNRYNMEGLYRGNLHTHKVKYNPYMHIRYNFIALIDSLQEDKNNKPLIKHRIKEEIPSLPRINITKEDKNEMIGRIQSYCEGLDVSDKHIIVVRFDFLDRIGLRMWPRNNYLELIERLLANEDFLIVLVGKQREELRMSDMKRLVNLTSRTTLRDLVNLFSISEVFVGHDGGIVHIASLTDVHIVALYGPETPLLYEPVNKKKIIVYKNLYCSPCVSAYNHRKSICTDNKCMQAITVEEVYKSVEKYI